MSENELKSVVAKYQQKSFELFNSNIVLEVQVETLQATINSLRAEIETLKKPKRGAKSTGDFEWYYYRCLNIISSYIRVLEVYTEY